MDIEIRDERDGDHGRYQLVVDGITAGELDHHTTGGVRTFAHTGVRPHHRGHGLAAELVQRGLADARAEGLSIDAQCSYVATYLRDHPEAGEGAVPTDEVGILGP